MKEKILTALKGADGFLSGETLCKKYRVSRAAVWKCIQKLRDEGYQIYSVTNRGYKLISAPDKLLECELRPFLNTKRIGQQIFWFDSTDSTSIRAREMSSDASDGAVFIAEEQTAGKGRLGREWISEKGAGVWISVLLKPDGSPQDMAVISLLAGVAVCKGIKKATGLEPCIKWPNDVLLENKKICGILSEMSAEFEKIHYVLLGIGINISNHAFPAEFSDHVSSLTELAGREIDRKQVAAQVINCLDECYDQFLYTGGRQKLLDAFRTNCITLGREVKATINGQPVVGKAEDVDETGSLILRTERGLLTLRAGEVSVRGLLGYA